MTRAFTVSLTRLALLLTLVLSAFAIRAEDVPPKPKPAVRIPDAFDVEPEPPPVPRATVPIADRPNAMDRWAAELRQRPRAAAQQYILKLWQDFKITFPALPVVAAPPPPPAPPENLPTPDLKLDLGAWLLPLPGLALELPILSVEEAATLEHLFTIPASTSDETSVSPSPAPIKIAALNLNEPSSEALALTLQAKPPLRIEFDTWLNPLPGPEVQLPILSPENTAAFELWLSPPQLSPDEVQLSPSSTPLKFAALNLVEPTPPLSPELIALAEQALLAFNSENPNSLSPIPGPAVELPILSGEEMATLNLWLTPNQLAPDEVQFSPSTIPQKVAALKAEEPAPPFNPELIALAEQVLLAFNSASPNSLAPIPGPAVELPILSADETAALNLWLKSNQLAPDEVQFSPSPIPLKVAELKLEEPAPPLNPELIALAKQALLAFDALDPNWFEPLPGPALELPILSAAETAALELWFAPMQSTSGKILVSPSSSPLNIAALNLNEPSPEAMAFTLKASPPLRVEFTTWLNPLPGLAIELPILTPEALAAFEKWFAPSELASDEIALSPTVRPLKFEALLPKEPTPEMRALATQVLSALRNETAKWLASTPAPKLPQPPPVVDAGLERWFAKPAFSVNEIYLSPSLSSVSLAALNLNERSAEAMELAARAWSQFSSVLTLLQPTPGPALELPAMTKTVAAPLRLEEPSADALALTLKALPPMRIDFTAWLDPLPGLSLPTPNSPTNTVSIKPPSPDPVPPKIETPFQFHVQLEKPLLNAGDPLIVGIAGPELFLRSAYALYTLTDPLGRQLEHGRVELGAVQPDPVKGARFKLDPSLQLALTPLLFGRVADRLVKLHLELEVVSPGHDAYKLGTEFAVQRPLETAAPEWNRWLSFSSAPPADGNWERFNRLGIFGGMQYRLNSAKRELLRKGAAPFYVENVSRQLLSRYHTERGLWAKTLAAMQAQPGSTVPFAREPSFCAPAFIEQYAAELGKIGDAYALDPPVFFSLSSEPSFTRLSAPADFDFSPAALEEFRRWLEREAYGTLPAVNEQWGTKFDKWDAIQPMTTDEARGRLKLSDYNFSPWMDFRAFCDFIFAKTLHDGAEVLRQRVPNTSVGITGAMGPAAFGGWDWSLLSRNLDVIEAYDIGNARALWRDLAPGKPALAAIDLPPGGGQAGANAVARVLWQLALEGGPRGAVFWDTAAPPPNGATAIPQPGDDRGTALFDQDGAPTELATGLAAVLKDLDLPAARLLAQARRAHDGVALLYSPASIRLYWLFEAEKLHGANWLARWGGDSTAERRESPQLRLRESWTKLLDDLGLGWRFVSSDELERGLLKRDASIKTLVLPRTIALSDREITAIQQFAEGGGRVIADSSCGRFDDHGKLRPQAPLDPLFGISSATEPLFPRPMRPLETIAPLVNEDGPLSTWTREFLHQLPPVFSDESKWIATERSGLRHGAEFNMSPVLARNGSALYLNLDLTDYLRWRLHPDLPRAASVRQALAELAFEKPLADSVIDGAKSKLPWGTQITRLNLGSGSKSGYILALRRNPQNRLHELGLEGDSNNAFENTEPFKLQLREPGWVCAEFPHPRAHESVEKTQSVQALAGMLDPVRPTFFVIQRAQPVKFDLALPRTAQRLKPVSLAVPAPEPPSPALFQVRVVGPDGNERPHYGATLNAPEGALKHAFTFALNDPDGTWSIEIQDLVSGRWSRTQLELAAGVPKLNDVPVEKGKSKLLPEPANE